MLTCLCASPSVGSDFEQLAGDDATPPPAVPALHVLFATPVMGSGFDAPIPSTDSAELSALRAELVDYIAGGLGGDKDAAEWVLLALLARM